MTKNIMELTRLLRQLLKSSCSFPEEAHSLEPFWSATFEFYVKGDEITITVFDYVAKNQTSK
jgi:hypothetical protein